MRLEMRLRGATSALVVAAALGGAACRGVPEDTFNAFARRHGAWVENLGDTLANEERALSAAADALATAEQACQGFAPCLDARSSGLEAVAAGKRHIESGRQALARATELIAKPSTTITPASLEDRERELGELRKSVEDTVNAARESARLASERRQAAEASGAAEASRNQIAMDPGEGAQHAH